MTRDEFIKTFRLNCYNKYSIPYMRNNFPHLPFFYSYYVSTVDGYYYGDVSSKLVSYSYAKKHNLKIFDFVIGFYCTQYGCVPLYLVLN